MKRMGHISNQGSRYKRSSDFSALKTQPSFFSPIIQPKLSINQPNDVYEQEADAMANKVMSMTPDTTHQNSLPSTSSIQRKCAACEEEEKNIQRKESGDAPANESSSLHQTLQSGGHPMNNNTRSFMEERFGYDFSNVRIHNDSIAHQSSRDINARAYTHGKDIVFGSGEYQPNTSSGKKLLAHELTHVIQQGGNNSIIQRQTAATINLKSPRFAGDPVLEAILDHEQQHFLRKGKKGDAVRKVQEALIDAGFPLPKFGADGDFGQETFNAVVAFQKASGLNFQQQDGIVGPNVLSRLDSRFPSQNAAGAPAVCPTPKKVSVDVLIFNGVNRNITQDIASMNSIYRPCCVEFAINKSVQLNQQATSTITGPDNALDVSDCDQLSSDEFNLGLQMLVLNFNSRIKLVYVNLLKPTSRGHSVSPKCGTGARNFIVNTAYIEAPATTRTPAHEVGHIILDIFGDHEVTTDNLMHVTPGSTGNNLAKVQCDIIFANT